MNKWHLIDVLRRRDHAARFTPRLDFLLALVALFLACWFFLNSADFRDALGTDKATLHAVAILLTWGFLLATAGYFAWWIRYVTTHHSQTPEETVDEIITAMEAGEERLAALAEKRQGNAVTPK